MTTWERIKRWFKKPEPGMLGALPSPESDKDWIKTFEPEKVKVACGGNEFPQIFSMANRIGGIKNQLSTNACSGFSSMYLMNVLISKTLGTYNQDYQINPFFNYYWGRYYSGFSTTEDTGAYLRSMLDGLMKKGVWACDMDSPRDGIPTDYDNVKAFKLKGYERIPQNKDDLIDNMKYVLAIEQLPIYICLKINYGDINMYSGEIRPSGLDSDDSGYHAMTIVGYRNDGNAVWFQTANSWGKASMDDGFAWIHEDCFKDTSYCTELWCPLKEYF